MVIDVLCIEYDSSPIMPILHSIQFKSLHLNLATTPYTPPWILLCCWPRGWRLTSVDQRKGFFVTQLNIFSTIKWQKETVMSSAGLEDVKKFLSKVVFFFNAAMLKMLDILWTVPYKDTNVYKKLDGTLKPKRKSLSCALFFLSPKIKVKYEVSILVIAFSINQLKQHCW